ncbi:Serine/threonine-protein phosphatase 2A activator 1 [Malassezia sp. CBS 17886]|nr:Serine/threonine-protein phosphatase 2A activator 1 [Malassezia sp. CBS 17886]
MQGNGTGGGDAAPLGPPAIHTMDPGTLARIREPKTEIRSDSDMGIWRDSGAHGAHLEFVVALSRACLGRATQPPAWDVPRSERMHADDPVDRTVGLLQELDAWTDEIAPDAQPQRFGNLAFRTWGARLRARVDELHAALLPRALHPYAVELRAYLCEAFGSSQRLDYGTGHELNFAAWLGYLYRLGVFGAAGVAEARLALEVFPAYLRVAWRLQDTYALEPAGSHGVWGLDDYQFLPYIFGAAQLQDTHALSPLDAASVRHFPFVAAPSPRRGPRISQAATLAHVPETLAGMGVPFPNLYTSSLARIHSLKRGAFAEHSPLLHDIASNVPNWRKVFDV